MAHQRELETIPGTRMTVDWAGLISAQNVVMNRLPVVPGHLSDKPGHADALRLGNGDIGVAVCADPECLVLYVGKNDLIDYRTKPLAHSPEATSASNAATTIPSTKPAGLIRFRNAAPRDPDTEARLDIWNAEVRTIPADREAPELRAFVARDRNLIVVECQPANGQEFDIELARHRDSTGQIPAPPEFGAEGRDMWVRYRFPPDPDTYPDGFEYVMYGRVLGGQAAGSDVVDEFATVGQLSGMDVERETVEGIARVRMRPAEPVTVLVAVVTTRDGHDPMQAARAEIESAQLAGLPAVRKEHARLWHEFWRRSFVHLEDRAFLNQQWFLCLYHLSSATRSGSVGPGLFGPWAWADWPPWGNDRHWDYNAEAALWGAFSCNHLELNQPYNEEVYGLLPAARMMVRDYYGGIPGAKFPGVSWPRNYTTSVQSRKAEFTTPWINGFVAQPLWWYYQYSQDLAFLREKGYPVIRACAEFYEHFVERAPDGKYDMPPTAVWDLAFMIPDARNAIIDLAFAKMLLRTAVAASLELGVDADRRHQWGYIADHLRDYPTTAIDGKHLKPVDRRAGADAVYTSRDFPSGKVLVVYEGFPVIEYNLPTPTMPIFPAGDIGLHSPPEQRELALKTLQITPYYLWDDLVMLTMAWVRLGCDQLDVFEKHTRSIVRDNGCQTYPRYIWNSKFIFMHFLGWPVVINESIVQSYTGQIRMAPVKLKNTVRFARLRTEGAFLVSGEIRSGGRVSYFTITSQAGRLCKLVRPWDGDVRVRLLNSEESVAVSEKEGVLEFATAVGSTYVVDRPDDPWEKQPAITIGG